MIACVTERANGDYLAGEVVCNLLLGVEDLARRRAIVFDLASAADVGQGASGDPEKSRGLLCSESGVMPCAKSVYLLPFAAQIVRHSPSQFNQRNLCCLFTHDSFLLAGGVGACIHAPKAGFRLARCAVAGE